MTTTAVFGGSFNPPHMGHEMVCLVALEAAPVDRIVMVPTYRHAFDKDLADFEHRFAMCELAAKIFGTRVRVSTVERDLATEGAQVSRTLDTLRRLAAESPNEQLRLLIGSDILAETDKWHRWDDVVRIAPPLVVSRNVRATEGSPLVVPGVSSSEVRQRLVAGQSVEGLVSRAVIDYIAEAGLYPRAV